MKTNRFFALILVLVAFATACKKDPKAPAAPSISGLEVGINNNGKVFPGNDLHLEAEITAPGLIQEVKVKIHGETGGGWTFEKVYTDGFKGLKNSTLHEHIDVPESAALGKYHLHLTVTDQWGQVTEEEADLEITIDPDAPTVKNFKVSLNAAGNDLHAEADLAAPQLIAKVEALIKNSSWQKSFEYTDATMVGKNAFHFHKHMAVGDAPAGHYHIHLKVIDQKGKSVEVEAHFDKN